MMKKLAPLIVSLALAAIALPAFALSSLRGDTWEPSAERPRKEMPEKRGAPKVRLNDKRLQNIAGYFDRMVRRLEAALEREKRLAERVEARIKKFEAKGAKVGEAKKKLEDARTAWQNAQKSLIDAKAKFETLKTSDDPKAAFVEVRKLVKDAVDLVKKTHASLVKVIISLKGASSAERLEKSPSVVPPKGGGIPNIPGFSQ